MTEQTEQTQQLKRVAATTADAVLAFIKMRLADTENNGAFTADQLRFYVNNNVSGGVSPGSADRVLRMLRQEGKLNYIVLNRGKSLYRAVPTLPVVMAEVTPAQS
jgi:hypothetical protein